MPRKPHDPFLQALAAYQANRLDETLEHCQNALKIKPEHPVILYLMGTAKTRLGDFVEAENLLRKSVAIKPGFAEAHFGFAQILSITGKYEESLAQYDAALNANSRHAAAFFGRGTVLTLLGRPQEAAASYVQALDVNPDFPEALNNLAVFHYENNDFDQAVSMCKRAVELKPDYAAAYTNLGNAYREQNKPAKAISCYRRALEADPDFFKAMNNLGLLLMYSGMDLDAAADCFDQILEKFPDNVPAMTHLAGTLCMKGRFHEGKVWLERALAIDPDYRDALNNLANAQKTLGNIDQALSLFERILAITPDDPDLHKNYAMTLLEAGNFEKGWTEYEWRKRSTLLKDAFRVYDQPQWTGEKGNDKTLLIYAEQGLGDTIQFCRYVPHAAERGWKIVLEVQNELMPLMTSLGYASMIFPMNAYLPPFDAHCPMMSLPLAMGTTAETIPQNVPYLSASREKVAYWKNRLPALSGKIKAGLVWTGNPRAFSIDLAMANQRRSIAPDALAKFSELPNVEFFSLQKGNCPEPSGLQLIDFMPECADFSDTAAVIANLDLVISVDTAVAHLAGAMGKPVWLLNRFDTCWRWFKNGTQSPWYPTMRIFRQPSSGDWDSPINQIMIELAKLK